MKPGRELDALVAEKVMGWKRDTRAYPYGMTWITAEGDDTGRFMTEYGSQECPPFSPSVDIASAWEVVEKTKLFREKQTDNTDGYSSLCQLWQSDDGKWVIGDWEDQLFILAEGETAPHAICLAALRMVGK